MSKEPLSLASKALIQREKKGFKSTDLNKLPKHIVWQVSNKETLYKALEELELLYTEIKNLKFVLYHFIKEYLQTKKIHWDLGK